jgi:beta-lactamase class A
MINDIVQSTLQALNCQYAFYYHQEDREALFLANCQRFPAASMIKVPILLAWLALERQGLLSRLELCSLDAEPVVRGSGFAWQFTTRQLSYADVLLMMIATSDNFCTNLVIQRAGRERLQQVFQQELGLTGSELQRKLFDLGARQRGLDNWISSQDCIRLYDLVEQLPAQDYEWVKQILSACQEDNLLTRDIPRDTITFHQKSGSINGVLHNWGFTEDRQIFLLTHQFNDELQTTRAFGELGRLFLL